MEAIKPTMLVVSMLLMMMSISIVHAEIYQWKDDDGNIHFTDKPLKKESTTVVDIDVQQVPDKPDDGELLRLQLIEQTQRKAKREAERKQNSNKKSKDLALREQKLEENNAKCWSARKKWYVLIQEMPVYWTNEGELKAQWYGDIYEGNRTYIHDKDRDGVMAEVFQEIEAYCANKDSDDENGSGYERWYREEHCILARSDLEHAQKEQMRSSPDLIKQLSTQVNELCS